MKENQNPDVNHRQLKVHYKYFHRVNTWQRSVIFPEIRLCGKWLQDLGFEHGQTINVLQEKNKIIITIDGGDQTAE